MSSYRRTPSSQSPLLQAAEGHSVDVGVVDGILQGVEYLLLAREEGAGGHLERRGVVGVHLAVAA